MLVVSCGGQDEPVAEMGDEIQLSDKEIMLGIDGWKPIAESRATIFENKEDILKRRYQGLAVGWLALRCWLRCR